MSAVSGNNRLQVLDGGELRKLKFGNMAMGHGTIATEKIKHDTQLSGARRESAWTAKDLSRTHAPASSASQERVYRTMELGRICAHRFRLDADATHYFIDANPNPEMPKRGVRDGSRACRVFAYRTCAAHSGARITGQRRAYQLKASAKDGPLARSGQTNRVEIATPCPMRRGGP